LRRSAAATLLRCVSLEECVSVLQLFFLTPPGLPFFSLATARNGDVLPAGRSGRARTFSVGSFAAPSAQYGQQKTPSQKQLLFTHFRCLWFHGALPAHPRASKKAIRRGGNVAVPREGVGCRSLNITPQTSKNQKGRKLEKIPLMETRSKEIVPNFERSKTLPTGKQLCKHFNLCGTR